MADSVFGTGKTQGESGIFCHNRKHRRTKKLMQRMSKRHRSQLEGNPILHVCHNLNIKKNNDCN